MRRSFAALVAVAALSAAVATHNPAGAEDDALASAMAAPDNAGPVEVPGVPFGTNDRLAAVVQTASPELLADIAAANQLTSDRVAQLAQDDTAFIDGTGRVLFQDPPREAGVAHGSAHNGGDVVEPATTFTLTDLSFAQRFVYLDFTGYELPAGTGWNGGAPVSIPPWYGDDVDLAEHATIQEIWQRVSEDFSGLDVGIYTEDGFSDGSLTRDDALDERYGAYLVFAPGEGNDYGICAAACGGASYLGVFDHYAGDGGDPNGHDYYQPGFVFGTGDAKALAEEASHQIGHMLGLSHDGHGADDLYSGHGPWAPIMGDGTQRPITHWSAGDYAGATNIEDDLAVMSLNGVGTLPDDHPDTIDPTAPNVAISSFGRISSSDDVDVFSLTAACTGPLTVNASELYHAFDLDIRLALLDDAGASIAASDPSAAAVDAATAVGLDAELTTDVIGGQQYFVAVEGVGTGTGIDPTYPDYSSMGRYSVEVADGQAEQADMFPGPPSWAAQQHSNLCATGEPGEPILSGEPNTVWFRVSVPPFFPGAATSLSTCNSYTNFDTIIAVYTGSSVDDLTLVAENDDAGVTCENPKHSTVTWIPAPGVTSFYVQVDGVDSETGVFSFRADAPNDGSVANCLMVPNSTAIFGSATGSALIGTPGDDVIIGGPGDDTIMGNGGNDVICGGGGDDVIHGGEGNDTIFGGLGNDMLYGEAGFDVLSDWQGDDRLDGGPDDDILEANYGADQLFGGDGNDVLDAGTGNDILHGGRGFDQLYGHGGADQLWGEAPGMVLGEADYLWGGGEIDLYEGGPGDDWLEGEDLSASGETMNGGPGNDIILGWGGDDTLNGGPGFDYLWGGAGIDLYFGGDDRDTLDGGGSPGDDGEIMNGGPGNDDILGWGGPDTLNGDAGSDYLWGGLGVDTFFGGDGVDYLDGLDDPDFGGPLPPEDAGEAMNGGGDNDYVIGWGGDDVLHGNAGSDYLWGGQGTDELHGDDDIDTCVDPQGSVFGPSCEFTGTS